MLMRFNDQMSWSSCDDADEIYANEFFLGKRQSLRYDTNHILTRSFRVEQMHNRHALMKSFADRHDSLGIEIKVLRKECATCHQ